MLSLIEIGPAVLEKKILKFHLCNFGIHRKRAWPFEHESPSPKNALCQVWLKLAQWFWRRRSTWEKFTTTTTTTTTDNGHILPRKAHLSLRLRWAKNNNILLCENFTTHLYIKCVYIITLRKKLKNFAGVKSIINKKWERLGYTPHSLYLRLLTSVH